MSRLFAILWSVALAISLHAQTETGHNSRASQDDIAAGAKTFRSHCAACHGLHGEGGRGPNLASGTFYHGGSDSELLQTISDGIAGTEMPGLFYSPDRVWQVIAYIRSLTQNRATNSRGDTVMGTRLFREKGCAGCHRVAGEGGRFGPDLTNIGATRSLDHLRESILDPNADVQQRYWVVNAVGNDGKTYSGFLMNEDTYTVQLIDFNEQLHSISKAALVSYKVEKTSKMPSYKEKLNTKELDDLIAYLSSLGPKPEQSDRVLP
jgi:putative heme-binding domain-containing protein